MDRTIQIEKGGLLNLPAELIEKYSIEEGDTYRVIDLDGVLILSPVAPLSAELSAEIEQARRAADVSLADLLHSLKAQHE